MAHGRVRSLLGAVTTFLAFATAGLAVVSAWRWISWDNASGWGMNATGGAFTVRHINSQVLTAKRLSGQLPLGWTSGAVTPPSKVFVWWISDLMAHPNLGLLSVRSINGFGIVGTYVTVVLWPLPPVLLALGWQLRRSGRRAAMRWKSGHCAKCGYNLVGLPVDASCPECGSARASGQTVASGSAPSQAPL